MALGLYTVLPGCASWDDGCRGLLPPALPVVGLTVGLLWLGIAMLAQRLMPVALCAVVVALTPSVLSGFLHLDGLMDVADAVLSARPQEEKRRILKDPHAGSFAVIALMCVLLAQVGATNAIFAEGHSLAVLALLPVVSRALAALMLMKIEPMPGSSYGRMNHDAATPGRLRFCAVCYGAAVIAAFLIDGRAGAALLAATIGFAVPCAAAVRSLGGMNGDIAGCGICCAELCGLALLACI